MSEEKLFVIMEVEREPNDRVVEGVQQWYPVGVVDNHLDDCECLWLKPSRIIPESRLRYGKPCRGERYFEPGEGIGWETWQVPDSKEVNGLILDPPPEPKSDWDEWCEDEPFPASFDPYSEYKIAHIEWQKRMPKED